MPAIDAPIQYRGTLNPQEQNYTYDYDPSTGGKQTYEYDTFSESKAVALANANIANRVPTKYRFEHGKATVVLQDSNFPGIDTWQIIANETQKSRWDHPAMLALLQYGGDPTADVYGKAIRVLRNGIDARTPFSSLASDPDISSLACPYLNNVYNLFLKGSDVYPSSQYVLRHTTNVGNAYNSNIADAYVDCVYSVNQLLSEVENSSLWIFPLPGELRYFIYTMIPPAYNPGYKWGWLKRSATRTTAAFNRVDLTTEYWLEQWEQTQLGSR